MRQLLLAREHHAERNAFLQMAGIGAAADGKGLRVRAGNAVVDGHQLLNQLGAFRHMVRMAHAARKEHIARRRKTLCHGRANGAVVEEDRITAVKGDGNLTLRRVHDAEVDRQRTGNGVSACDAEIHTRIALARSLVQQADRSAADAELRVAYSFVSAEAAERQLSEHTGSFDETRAETRAVWERYLSRIEIDADDETREIFYSNLYHSLLKPSSTLGESFVGDCKHFDFSTIWDMYKTALPLILTLCPDEAEGIARTFLSAMAVRERSPISMPISGGGDIAMQARMLMEHSLADYYFRYGKLAAEILDAAEKDLMGQTDFLETGLCERYTHVLDITEALGAMAEIAREIGDGRAEHFARLASGWRRVYDVETGLLSSSSQYYEGTAYNYSFRQMREMDERVRITGSTAEFVDKMDELFGYTREPVVQHKDHEIDPLTLGINSFEGFNNESDIEAPYSYVWVDQHYKTAEIVRGGMRYMYARGRGGIPGNNDSGALSSNYVWSALGLFPISGQNLMVIGSPIVRSARLRLGTGSTLKISVVGDPDTMTYVESAELNGVPVRTHRFSVRDMMGGGELVIKLTDKRPEA